MTPKANGRYSTIFSMCNESAVQAQVARLNFKNVGEDKADETRTADILHEWEHNKPFAGKTRSGETLQQLQLFEYDFSHLNEEHDNVAKAKEALELQDSAETTES